MLLERTASGSRQVLLQPQTLRASVQVRQVYAYRLPPCCCCDCCLRTQLEPPWLVLQAEVRQKILCILEKAGLNRQEQGSVLVVNVRDIEEKIKVEDVGKMPLTEVSKLYTVNS